VWCRLISESEITLCVGTIENEPHWETYDGRMPAQWRYGVVLDVGGGTASGERQIEPLDVVTGLGDVVR